MLFLVGNKDIYNANTIVTGVVWHSFPLRLTVTALASIETRHVDKATKDVAIIGCTALNHMIVRSKFKVHREIYKE